MNGQSEMNHQHNHAEAAAGAMFSLSGAVVSMIPQIEEWIRLASLSVGLIIGLVTLYRMFRKQ